VIFAVLAAMEVRLLHVSGWVSRGPIFVIWSMYLLAPWVYAPTRPGAEMLRRYSVGGWFFVLGAAGWAVCYFILCNKYGVPVSWETVKEQWMRGNR
jgi:hypothetical protein